MGKEQQPSMDTKRLRNEFPSFARRLLPVVVLIFAGARAQHHKESQVDDTLPCTPATSQLDDFYFDQFAPIKDDRFLPSIDVFGEVDEDKLEVAEMQAVIQEPSQENQNGSEVDKTITLKNFSEIEPIVTSHPELFSPQDIEDLKMYYPIYTAVVSKKYEEEYPEIPWYLLWIIHNAESTVSRNPQAFVEGRPHYGAGQRDTSLHPQENVESAASGLEFLADLPQRHADDWKELAWVNLKLKQDWKRFGSLLNALIRYTVVHGREYYEEFLYYQRIFE